ncbi:hypothetical protein [Thermotoga sp.]|uniref:hypothetical protein n=1 Tax=Thermotoga sp. TaxID=28240 RepID=UPI0025EAEAFC|nr:hypothetical protein [Thermotoga sp.]MCD6552083.1 tetratricopeptide repeat protein [Thermotoga sp.]
MHFKRFLPVLLSGLALAIFLFSCAGPITVGPGGAEGEDLSNLLESGLDSLASGNIDDAKSTFEDVLSEDPENATANAGMSVILLYELFRDYSSEISQLTGVFRSVPVRFGPFREITRSFSFMKYFFMSMKQFPLPPEPPVQPPPFLPEENPLETWNQLYETVSATLSELWPRLKELELCLERAITGNASLTLYPNNFDWDGDDVLEPEEPLELSDGTNTYSVVDLLYGSVSPEGTLVIVQSGGDAWFDFETVSGQNPENIIFDENDYLILDKGEFSALLFVVKAALSISDLLLTWDLTLPSDLPNPSGYDDMETWLQAVLDYIDNNNDNMVDNTSGDGGEWNNLNPFLVFRENGSAYLEDLVDSIVMGIQSVLWFNEDIEEDDPGGEHDLTSLHYFEEPPIDEETVNTLQEIVDTHRVELPEGEPFTYKQTETETFVATIVAIDFGVLQDNPSGFENLKVFFPTLDLSNEYYEFPDPTFGGLLELEEE